MRGSRGLVTASLIVLAAAPAADALVISVRDAAGNVTSITDNGRGDANAALGTIDFDFSTAAVAFTATGRLEEITNGPTRLLRLTATPGQPAVGNYGNTSRQAGVFEVIADSSPFAAVAAGTPWRLGYVGSGFDGPVPSFPANACNGNGAVTIPVHQVTGQLNAGAATLDTARGPAFFNAAPAGFSVSRTGVTAVPATSLRASWLLDPDTCDGITLPDSIELELVPPYPEDGDDGILPPRGGGAWMPWVVLILLVFVVVLHVDAALKREQGKDE